MIIPRVVSILHHSTPFYSIPLILVNGYDISLRHYMFIDLSSSKIITDKVVTDCLDTPYPLHMKSAVWSLRYDCVLAYNENVNYFKCLRNCTVWG